MPQMAERLQTCRKTLHSSAVQQLNNSDQTEKHLIIVLAPNNTHTITRGVCVSKHTHARAHIHTHSGLHMLKPLSCCLLSHYSVACYFLKLEKAIS